jgi:hypothetical protein
LHLDLTFTCERKHVTFVFLDLAYFTWNGINFIYHMEKSWAEKYTNKILNVIEGIESQTDQVKERTKWAWEQAE